ncbi:hypothetical protein GCM10028857_23740 [Salinarchaeum chitinilyticum]
MSEPDVREPTTTRDGVGGVAATLARFDRPRGPKTTFAVLADTHLTEPGNSQRPTVAEEGSATTARQQREPSRRRLQRALADAERLDVDAVLVAGDLTRTGAGVEHELAADLLGDAPAPVITVPGDRDVAADGEPPYPEDWTAAAGPTACPYARRIDGVTVLGVDTATGDDAVPTATHGGAITRAERSWIARTARADPDPTICLTHHPIAPLPGTFDDELDDRRHRVRSPARTADVLADAGVELAIGGHLRWPTATRYRGCNVVGAPSTTAFPPSYLLIDVEPRGTTVSLVPLTDWAGLESAYETACRAGSRGDAVRSAVTDGYFGDLPAVDAQRDPSPQRTASPTPLRRP